MRDLKKKIYEKNDSLTVFDMGLELDGIYMEDDRIISYYLDKK